MSSRPDIVKLAIALSGGLGSFEFVFDDDDVVQLLRIAIEHEGTQIAFAKRHHIDRAYLNMVLNGKRVVTDGVAEAIGLRKVYMPNKFSTKTFRAIGPYSPKPRRGTDRGQRGEVAGTFTSYNRLTFAHHIGPIINKPRGAGCMALLMGRGRSCNKLEFAMRTTARFEIPENLAPIEIEANVFISPTRAKVKHWRAALKDWHNEGAIPQQRQIKQMIEIADALRLSGDVVLLPYLVSLESAESVVAIKPRR